jgi:5-methylcytosine-specific restriction endonuclease McrA
MRERGLRRRPESARGRAVKLYTCKSCGKIGPERYCELHRVLERPKNAHWSRQRDSYLQGRFRKAVLARDDFRCQKCGLQKADLRATHIRPLRTFAIGDARAYDPANGMTLCVYCDVQTDPYARRSSGREHTQAKPGELNQEWNDLHDDVPNCETTTTTTTTATTATTAVEDARQQRRQNERQESRRLA